MNSLRLQRLKDLAVTLHKSVFLPPHLSGSREHSPVTAAPGPLWLLTLDGWGPPDLPPHSSQPPSCPGSCPGHRCGPRLKRLPPPHPFPRRNKPSSILCSPSFLSDSQTLFSLCSSVSTAPEGPCSCRQLTGAQGPFAYSCSTLLGATQWEMPRPMLGRFHVILALPSWVPEGSFQQCRVCVVRFCSAL